MAELLSIAVSLAQVKKEARSNLGPFSRSFLEKRYQSPLRKQRAFVIMKNDSKSIRKEFVIRPSAA